MHRRCCRQHRRCIIPQAVNNLVLLRMGENYCPKHVELIWIINKPLLLHLVGCLYYCICDARSYKHQNPNNILHTRPNGELTTSVRRTEILRGFHWQLIGFMVYGVRDRRRGTWKWHWKLQSESWNRMQQWAEKFFVLVFFLTDMVENLCPTPRIVQLRLLESYVMSHPCVNLPV
jgi:hypothetical protein